MKDKHTQIEGRIVKYKFGTVAVKYKLWFGARDGAGDRETQIPIRD